MIKAIIIAILWSISPFGEAKVGIPYGILNNVNIYVVFTVCFIANVLVFPIMMFFLEHINRHLLKWNPYKKSALFVARRAKTGSGAQIKKYGFWGLILFVMIPLPGTGVYAGSIASYIFKIEKRKAFLGNVIGIFFSSIIVWVATIASMQGLG
ncbi:COG2426 family protein [Aquimarina agarivorans]|uniref:COG2426 family protein n=1 Tax=Aquimarina agarivorans TaxID=980584 RepID=UPI000248ED54|nr:small multi-drug export protein [Aquimarina agarivorans]